MGDNRTDGPSTRVPSSSPRNYRGSAYGEPISAEREQQLQRILDAWHASGADRSGRPGPFAGMVLTGGDVFWLANQARVETPEGSGHSYVFGLRLDGALLPYARLEKAEFQAAWLEETDLFGADLREANMSNAYLVNATLSFARLERANLVMAHLEGANLSNAHLEGADLSGARLDNRTMFNEAVLDRTTHLGDIQWSGVGAVNLTRINWDSVTRLGDEQDVTLHSPIQHHEIMVRTYRQVSAQLRAQGMAEVADRFAERAQIRQRILYLSRMLANWHHPWRIPGDFLRWLFSWFLALLAGYGYHPGRSVFWYLATIIGFAALYSHFGVIDGHAFNPVEAAVFSLTSFHGRGFFPGGLALDSPVTILAAVEAVIGLLIEISFIATFTQRFFGTK